MNPKGTKHSFWTTLPGILTGLAGAITAATGLYVALNHRDQKTSADRPPVSPTEVKAPSSATTWPMVAEEAFTALPAEWFKGTFLDKDKFVRSEHGIVGGKYRWEMEFRQPAQVFIDLPYGSATDFQLSVDLRFVESTSDELSGGIIFGKASNKELSFHISSNGKYSLSRFDGKHDRIIEWTPIRINPSGEANRISVTVENQQIRMYVNANLVGVYKDFTFTGGKFALTAQAYKPNVLAVMDFDNFEFRRKAE